MLLLTGNKARLLRKTPNRPMMSWEGVVLLPEANVARLMEIGKERLKSYVDKLREATNDTYSHLVSTTYDSKLPKCSALVPMTKEEQPKAQRQEEEEETIRNFNDLDEAMDENARLALVAEQLLVIEV